MRHLLSSTLALALATSGAASAQQLLVVESTNDDVMLFDANDGSLINPSFIDLSPYGAQTPIECIVGPTALYVTDQLSDAIYMFSLDGSTYLGTISGGLDNIRGGCWANNTLYIANSGTGNGAPGPAVVMFDAAGNPLGNFPVGDPFDVVEFQGGLLTCDIAGEDLALWDFAGNSLGLFHDSDGVSGIDFPEQASVRPSTGGILCNGFSAPAGVYDYDSAGVQQNYWTVTTGGRGVFELCNGDIMFTDGNGVYTFDTATVTVTTVLAGVSGRFISSYGSCQPGTAYCFCDINNPTGNAAPCGNFNDGSDANGAGCAHDDSAAGANLDASGMASVTADTLLLVGTRGPVSNSSLFFQANNNLDGTGAAPLGDGVRCAGGGLIRLKVKTTDPSGYADSSPAVITARSASFGHTIQPGETLYYQWWFRDANGSPCSTESNTSNGYKITWTL